MSPWAVKRLHEYGGDISKFRVVKRYPSTLEQIAISKTEPGDENNQDISSLVGKVDIRKLEEFRQDDPDAYSFSGGLCLANQGLMEFVEMFKAPIKVLHPLLTATQEGNYKGTEGFGAIPFDGVILAHSNESEWQTFRNNKNNEAFLDRIYIVKVPYCLRVTDEIKIYEKLLATPRCQRAVRAGHAEDDGAVRRADAPEGTGELEPVLEDAHLRRREPEGHRPEGEMLPGVPRLRRRRRGHERSLDALRVQDSVESLQLRRTEIAANPVHLLYVLEQQIEREQFAPEKARNISLHQGIPGDALRRVHRQGDPDRVSGAYSEYGQNIFDRYVTFADFWIQDQEYRDPNTGEILDRGSLNDELEKIEKPAGIGNPKDFRHEIVNFVLRARANNDGRNPAWTSYEKLRTVIEKKMFSTTEDLLPVIRSTPKPPPTSRRSTRFVDRMVAKGYTPKQVRLLFEWYLRVRKSS